jgi:Major Facilitator Superfamily.
MFNKNLIIIFLCSTIGTFAPVVTVLLSGIIGSQLIETDWASTLPMSLMICGTFIFAPIASKIFSLIGRKKGFMTASLISSLAAIICSYSITISNFYFFSIGCMFIGAAHSFVHQYRFAVPESVDKEFVPRAMSYILLLGIVSALLASNSANLFKDLTDVQFTGSFLFLSVTALIPVFFLFFYKDEKINIEKTKFEYSRINSILKNPKIILSIVCGGVGYYVMASIMTASSLFLHIFKEIYDI